MTLNTFSLQREGLKGRSMRLRSMGWGEWVGVGYATLVIGSLVEGFFSTGSVPSILLAFVVGLLMALALGRLLAVLDPPARSRRHRE